MQLTHTQCRQPVIPQTFYTSLCPSFICQEKQNPVVRHCCVWSYVTWSEGKQLWKLRVVVHSWLKRFWKKTRFCHNGCEILFPTSGTCSRQAPLLSKLMQTSYQMSGLTGGCYSTCVLQEWVPATTKKKKNLEKKNTSLHRWRQEAAGQHSQPVSYTWCCFGFMAIQK